MGLNVKNKNGPGVKIDTLDIGSYPGWLSTIVYVGEQERNAYMGEEKPNADEVFMTYELADEFLKGEDGEEDTTRPRTLFENFYVFGLKSENATSTKRYYALDPKVEHDGEWESLLGAPCMINMVHNKAKSGDRIYENVDSISTLRAKDVNKMGTPVLEAKFFDVYNPDMEMFDSLPEFLQNKVKSCVNLTDELREMYGLDPKSGDSPVELDDEIPF